MLFWSHEIIEKVHNLYTKLFSFQKNIDDLKILKLGIIKTFYTKRGEQ